MTGHAHKQGLFSCHSHSAQHVRRKRPQAVAHKHRLNLRIRAFIPEDVMEVMRKYQSFFTSWLMAKFVHRPAALRTHDETERLEFIKISFPFVPINLVLMDY